jgi:hypothetical protein
MNTKPLDLSLLLVASTFELLLVVSFAAQPSSWSPRSLLQQPQDAYSEAAISQATGFVRDSLLIDMRRSEYYGALYAKDYSLAYSRLASRLKERLTKDQFQAWFEGLIEQPENSATGIALAGLREVRLSRGYLAKVNGATSTVSIMALTVGMTIHGKQGLDQTIALLDAWTVSDGDAWVIPAEFATIQVVDESPW